MDGDEEIAAGIVGDGGALFEGNEAVIAARCAAVAVLTAEANKTPEELAPEQAERVRKEGWIYGLGEPA